MDTTDTLISLQAMAPNLSSEEISNVFFNECSQDFDQSVDYLIKLAMNPKNKENNINKNNIKIQSNDNQKRTIKTSSSLNSSDIPSEICCRPLPKYFKIKSTSLEEKLNTNENVNKEEKVITEENEGKQEKKLMPPIDRRTIQSTDKDISFCSNIGRLLMSFNDNWFVGTATVFSVNPQNRRVYAVTCGHNLVEYDENGDILSEVTAVYFEHRKTNATAVTSTLLNRYLIDEYWIHDTRDIGMVSFIDTRVEKWSLFSLNIGNNDMNIVYLAKNSFQQSLWINSNVNNGGFGIYGFPGDDPDMGEFYGERLYGHAVHNGSDSGLGDTIEIRDQWRGQSLAHKIDTTGGQSGSSILRLTVLGQNQNGVKCKITIIGIHTAADRVWSRNYGEKVDKDFFVWIRKSLMDHPMANLGIFENLQFNSD